MKKLSLKLIASIAAIGLLGSTLASGQVLLAVDFNLSGDPASPTQSGFSSWNFASTTVTSPQSQSFGIYTVNLIGNGDNIAGRDRTSGGNPTPPNGGSFTQSDLMRDFVQGLARTGATIDNVPTTAANNTSFTISGFAASTQYTFQLWALDRGANNGNVTSWWNTTNGTGANATSLGSIVNSTAAGAPANNNAFSVSGTVTSDANGFLRFGATNTSPQQVFMNGFQVSVIPEPTTALLIGLGLGGILLRRRCRIA